MRDFFYGWRRKLGCVTLFMALGFSGEWFRSDFVYDRFAMYRNNGAFQIYSVYGRIFVTTDTGSHKEHVLYGSRDIVRWQGYQPERSPPNAPFDPLNNFRFVSRWDCVGFHRGTGQIGPVKYRSYTVPFWSVVLAFTLLSAKLLLSKPPRPTPSNDTFSTPQTSTSTMREFFRGWRRKLGCLTLLASCACMAGWVRSLFATDTAAIPLGNHSAIVLLAGDQLFGLQYRHERQVPGSEVTFGWLSFGPRHISLDRPVSWSTI